MSNGNETLAPHQGPGLEPARSVLPAPSNVIPISPNTGRPDGVIPSMTMGDYTPPPVGTPHPEIPGGVPLAPIQATPPPVDPGMTQQLAERDQRIGELINRIGKIERDYQLQLDEMRLNFEMTLAAQQGGNPQGG